MLKLYLDWNVMSQIKNGYDLELKSIIDNNSNLFIPYSTSHIGDIFSSYTENGGNQHFIDSDLSFISKLTENKCLIYQGKDVLLDYINPKDLFYDRVRNKDNFKDLSFDSVFNLSDFDEESKVKIEPLLHQFKSIPIDRLLTQTIKDPNTTNHMKDLFPGLIENPTMEGFINSLDKMINSMNESIGYKKFRNFIQQESDINRDEIYNSENPFDRIYQKHKRKKTNPIKFIDSEKFDLEWFNNICNDYLILDSHGYQEDKVNIEKGRKETFKNTFEDSMHAAFASTCHFYVTNDKKSYSKTKMVYKNQSIETIVFKPTEFVEYYNKYLNVQNEMVNFTILYNIISTKEFNEEELSDGGILRTYYSPFLFFNFFNKIMILYPEDGSDNILLLGKYNFSNHRTYFIEIKKLYINLCVIFGSDIDNLGEIKDKELSEENWIGRKWIKENMTFRLANSNGHLQLYFE